ncbi:MAG: YgeY family selenium metabolism-linked hydrolase [Lachnospiraceae bacterium]|nr:YgeY family selenium metabolism-linked hydrolase [Lachnospiraceae bacterium]
MLTKEREERLVDFCRKMIQAKSYSGEENLVVEEMKKFCDAEGFTDVHVDRYGNCICHIKGKRPGTKVLFDGHMDTVPVPDPSAWKHDPFGAEIVDGKMYGRGTSDMKGALSAMLAAAAYYAKDCDYDFPGDIYVAGVVHEECFEGVAAREISAYVKPDYVIIGEASQLNIKIGQRGRAEIQVETFGKPAHSASPQEGVNAVYKMCKVVEAIRGLAPTNHPVLGDGILELVDIKSSPYPGASVVPDYCRATYDRRLLVGETKESVLAPLQELLDRLMEEDPELKAKVSFVEWQEKCYTGETIESERFFPGWLFDEKEDFVQDVYHEMKELGLNPSITNYNFCTNGSHYAGEAGIRTMGIGPSKEILAHTIDKYIEIEQLLKVMQCYYGAMRALLK